MRRAVPRKAVLGKAVPRKSVFLAGILLCLCLCGCAHDGGLTAFQFGETEYSEDAARAVLRAFLAEFDHGDLSGGEWSVVLEKDVNDEYLYWRDDTYTAAYWRRAGTEHLWYRDVLYTAQKDAVAPSYDRVSWEALHAQEKKRKYCEELIAGVGVDDPERLGVKRLEREPALPDILLECGFSAGRIFDG